MYFVSTTNATQVSDNGSGCYAAKFRDTTLGKHIKGVAESWQMVVQSSEPFILGVNPLIRKERE